MITMIVDSSPEVVQRMKQMLLRLEPNSTHWQAYSAAEALELALLTVPDVMFLKMQLDGGGVALAKRAMELVPSIHIVFLSENTESAYEAFEVFADGFLLEPPEENKLRAVLENIHRKGSLLSERRLKIQCFGPFEVYSNGAPVKFQRRKTKELLAFLVDRNGAMATNHDIIVALWHDERETPSRLSQLRTMIADIQTTFTNLDVGKVLRRERGAIGLDKSMVDCDYYEYLKGTPAALRLYKGEYLSAYAFAEPTRKSLKAKK